VELLTPLTLFRPDLRLIVQDDVQQRAMDFDMTIVIDESKFSKSVHEEANE